MMTRKSLAQGFGLLLLISPLLQADPIHGVTWSWHRWTSEHTGVVSNAPIYAPAPAPLPTPTPVPVAAPAPAPTLFLTPSAPVYTPPAPSYTPPAPAYVAPVPIPASQGTADAFVNLSTGGFAGSDILNGSQPKAWYLSPVVTNLYGGMPSDQQKADFSNSVLQRVNDTFHASGLNPNLTNDPNAMASHTLSVVSSASLSDSPGTIGLTSVGHSGFTFIDQLGSATSVDQLATVIAKNVSHELMHAFGIGIHPDQTGQNIDAASVSFDILSNQNAKFSDQAAQDILATKYGSIPFASTALGAQSLTAGHTAGCNCPSCAQARQMLGSAQAVPEPATLLIWSVVAIGGLLGARSEVKNRAWKIASH